MINKLNRNYNIIVMIDKINEIIDFLNETYIKCPHCGNSYYEKIYSLYPSIYKNGVNIDPNIRYRCLSCGKEFTI